MKEFDYNRPKKSSPLIATIGRHTNLTQSVTDYFHAVSAIITKEGEEGRFFVPKYKPIDFETVEDFNTYIASPEYKRKINGSFKDGICMGV